MQDHKDVKALFKQYQQEQEDQAVEIEPYEAPVGAWGSMAWIARHMRHHAAFGVLVELPRQNKVDGFACVSCAWAKPADASQAGFCENGAKATFADSAINCRPCAEVRSSAPWHRVFRAERRAAPSRPA